MPRLNRPSARLAALASERQDAALAHADSLCTAVDAAVLRVWRQLLKTLAAPPGRHPYHPEVYQRAVAVLRLLPAELVGVVEKRLLALAWWGHRTAGGVVIEAVPAARLTAETRDLILAPPPPEQVVRIVFGPMHTHGHGLTWQQRIGTLTGLARPETLALSVATGLAQGKTLREVAADLAPAVQGVQASARRVARTEGMRVAHESQHEAWEALGDMIVGFQIHAQRDQHTRPWHAERDGRVYYKRPAGDQLGLGRMPRPPLESPDPRDRPAKAPQVAPNCRCFLTPVLESERT